MNIAVTGGICTGKSEVSQLLAALLKAELLSADGICRDLLVPGEAGWRGVKQKWGNGFFDDQGNVDRVALRRAIFASEETRQELENILHPLVRQTVSQRAGQLRQQEKHLLVEVPLLFEVGWQGDFDWVVTVYAPAAMCLQRIISRDGVSADEAGKVIAAQMDIEQKVALADSVIDNSGAWADTSTQIHQLARFLENKIR